MDEIIEWPDADENRQREIVEAARQRLLIIGPDNPHRSGPP